MNPFPSHPIKIGDKDCLITPPNLATEGLFQDYLRKAAVQDVVRLRDTYNVAFQDALAAVTRDVSAGVYDWFGEAFLRSLFADRHMQQLATFVLNQDGQKVTLDEIRKHWRDQSGDTITSQDGKTEPATVGQILFKYVYEYISRPNSPAPALP